MEKAPFEPKNMVVSASAWKNLRCESDMFSEWNHFQKFKNGFGGHIFSTFKANDVYFELALRSGLANIVKALFCDIIVQFIDFWLLNVVFQHKYT